MLKRQMQIAYEYSQQFLMIELQHAHLIEIWANRKEKFVYLWLLEY